MNGKGSKPRPLLIPRDTFGERWDRVFKDRPKDLDKRPRQSVPFKTTTPGDPNDPT